MERATSVDPSIRIVVLEDPDAGAIDVAGQLDDDRSTFAVRSEPSAEAVVELLADWPADCVICVHDPPAIDGIDVLAELRQQYPELPILVATEGHDADRAVSREATDVLQLSDGQFDRTVVQNRLQRLAHRSRALGEYEQIFERANDGITIHDRATGEILEANGRLYRMLGYERGAAAELTLADLAAGDAGYTAEAVRDLVSAAADGDDQTVEWLAETAQGERRWVELSLEAVRIGGVERVLGFVRDITDRKENERLLRDREQQLDAAFDHPAAFAAVLDAEGRVVRANDTALEMTGLTAADIEGAPIWEADWWPNAAEAERIRDSIAALGDGETTQLEVGIATGEGRRVIDLRIDAIPTDDGDTRAVVIGYDVTERAVKEAELESQRTALHALHEITADPALSLDDQVERLLEFGTDHFGTDIGFLSEIDRQAGSVRIAAATGDHDLIHAGAGDDLGNTFCRHVIDDSAEMSLAITDAEATLGADPAVERYGLDCYIGVAIEVNGDLFGTLCFADAEPCDVTEGDRTLLELMGQWLRRGLEQRDYERQLEAAKDRYERTLDRIDDAFFALNDDWVVTYANAAGESALREAMGLEPTDHLLGRQFWDELPDSVKSTVFDRYRTALETQESVVFQEYADALDRWLEIRAYPDEDGLSVYLADVTERVERERELSLTETIVSNVGDGVYVLDESFEFVRVNDAYCEMTGYDRDELLGTHCSVVVDDAVADASADRMSALLDDENATLEADLHRADGSTVRAESKFTAVTAPNGGEWKVGVVRDVSDRVARERELERLGDLLDQAERIAAVGGWEVDVATEQVYWTDHLFDLLGVDYDDEPRLDEALDVYLEEDRPRIESAVDDAIEHQEPFDVELRIAHSPDDIRWLRVQGVPIVEDGEVRKIRGAAQDVTGRKERDRRMRGLLDATRSFIGADDESALIDSIVEALSAVFGYDIATVRLHDPEQGTLEPTRFTDRASALLSATPVDDDEGVLGEAFQSAQPLVVNDLAAQGTRAYGPIESAMVLPLGHHGIVGIGATEADRFDSADAALVEVLALAATSAFDRLEREADTRRLRRTVEAVEEMVFLLDRDGEIGYATETLAEYLGVAERALTGSPFGAYLTEATRGVLDRAIDELRSGDAEARTVEVELRTDGEAVKPVELMLSTSDSETDDMAIAGVVADISELAETRSTLATQLARFRELFENLPDPVVEVRFDGDEPIIEYANPAFMETFGYDVTSAQGENLNELIVPDDAETVVDTRELGESGGSVDVRRSTATGRRDFLLRGIPYQRGGQWFAFDIYTDITARKERERYHQILNRVLRHNLRNDMNVVMALANRLDSRMEDAELASLARKLFDKAEDIAALSDKATEIERVLGSRGAEPEPIDAVEYVEAVIADARERHPDADIDLEVPADLRVMAGHELARVFEELVDNALVHGCAAPQLRVRADRSPSHDRVEIQFVDDGPGIPDDEWEIVTSESDISQLTHASGLGLWLARWITESYGGRLVRRADGDRTVVGVRLQSAEPD